MKINNLTILTILLLLSLITIDIVSAQLQNNNANDSNNIHKKVKQSKFDAFKILKPPVNKFYGKMLFMFQSQVDKRKDFALNRLDYKYIQITEDSIIVYYSPIQSSTVY